MTDLSKYEPYYTEGNYSAYHTNGEGFIDYTEAEKLCEDLADINVFMHCSGMAATHNMPCPVCKITHAVLSDGVFQPCWKCQADGYEIVKFRKPWHKKLLEWWYG